MDRGDVSIEKVAEQFLVEGSEIENRDGPYTADDYIPTSKNIPADFLHSFDQNEHYTVFDAVQSPPLSSPPL